MSVSITKDKTNISNIEARDVLSVPITKDKTNINNIEAGDVRMKQSNTTHLTDHDVAKFRRQRENAEQFNFTESWFQQLVVRCHGVVSDVVVAGNAAQLSHLQSTSIR